MFQKKSFERIVMYMGCLLVVMLPCSNARAALIQYELSGQTAAPIDPRGGSEKYPFNHGLEFVLNWEGSTLIHDTGWSDSARDDRIHISGQVQGCVGQAGGNCFGSGDFRPAWVLSDQPVDERTKQDDDLMYVGEGTFELQDVEFRLDSRRTQGTEDLYANADKNIGKLVLVDQELPGAGRHTNKRQTIHLGLKQHPDLKYAFRLFDEEPLNDSLYRILTWMTANSWTFTGKTRFESKPGESVFNGDILACRVDGSGCGHQPPTEVPEPFTAGLLLSGIVGAALTRRKFG